MSRVTTAALASQAAAAGLEMVTPQGRFRRVLELAIPTGGEADGATVSGTTVLRATFLAREVDATAPGAPEPAALTTGAAGLVLSLPVAREVARIRLAAPQAGDRIAAFRFDGAAVSDDAVVAAAHGSGGAAIGVTDRALVLRRRNAGDHALAPAAIAAVFLRYAPANPRILIALAGDPAGEQALPPLTGAAGEPVFPPEIERGGAVAAALQAAIERLAAAGPLPDALRLALILEADQPCAARIDALDIGLRLARRGFAGLPGKQVLRFGGSRRETQERALGLPSAAADLEGRLGVSISGAPAASAPAAPLIDPPAAGADGVALAGGVVVSGRLDLPEAAVVVGAEVVLSATEPLTVVRATLQADRNGRPDAVLATSGDLVPGGAVPAPLALALPPTAVPAGPVWLTLTALRGRAVAMLGHGGATLVMGDGAAFAPMPAAADRGLAAVLRLAAPANPPPGGLVLRLGGVVLPVVDGMADLTAALASSAPPPSVLSVSADARVVVTLDPPLLRYSLPL